MLREQPELQQPGGVHLLVVLRMQRFPQRNARLVQQLQHGVRQLWQVILKLEAQLGREESKGLHQAFDIRVAATLAQQPGKLWVVFGEVVAEFVQVTQFFAETVFQ